MVAEDDLAADDTDYADSIRIIRGIRGRTTFSCILDFDSSANTELRPIIERTELCMIEGNS